MIRTSCARAWAEFRAVWAEQGLVTLFTRFHPLLGEPRATARVSRAARTPGGELTPCSAAASRWTSRMTGKRGGSGYPQVLRQEIKESERAGLVVEEDDRLVEL